MPKLHFYINGTDGQADGTEVTQLTFKNMKKYMITYTHDGYQYPLSYIFLSLRFDTGYKGTVKVSKLLSGPHNQLSGCFTTKYPTTQLTSKYISENEGIETTITDVNTTLLLVLVGSKYTSHIYKGENIALTDMVSFSYVLEKA